MSIVDPLSCASLNVALSSKLNIDVVDGENTMITSKTIENKMQ